VQIRNATQLRANHPNAKPTLPSVVLFLQYYYDLSRPGADAFGGRMLLAIVEGSFGSMD
jgi:hypothetical protein